MRKPVPCNGCTACCQNDAVRLLPGDDPAQYLTEPHFAFPGHLMLAHKPNGECFYLTKNGCAIHDRSPIQCQGMDCRVIAQKLQWSQARKMRGLLRVWRKGKDLLNQAERDSHANKKRLPNKGLQIQNDQ